LENVEKQQASSDTRVSHLLVVAGEGDKAQAQLDTLIKQREDLREKVKVGLPNVFTLLG
jgi:hypothetical protein